MQVPRNGPVRCRISHRAIQILITAALLRAPAEVIHAQQSRAPFAQTFPAREKIAAPIVLCIDDKPTAGGQPTSRRLRQRGGPRLPLDFDSALPSDGVDPLAERPWSNGKSALFQYSRYNRVAEPRAHRRISPLDARQRQSADVDQLRLRRARCPADDHFPHQSNKVGVKRKRSKRRPERAAIESG